MSMTYIRKMNLKYNNRKITDTQLNQLAYALQQEGLTLHDWGYSVKELPEYGYREVTSTTPRFVILNYRKQIVFADRWRHNVQPVYNSMKEFYKIEMAKMPTILTETKWVEAEGERLSLADKVINLASTDQYELEDNLTLEVKLLNNFRGLNVKTTTTWITDKVQRDDLLEAKLVQSTLDILARTQSIFEKALLKTDIETFDEPIVDCQFSAMNYTTSECKPDIIRMMKDRKEEMDEVE